MNSFASVIKKMIFCLILLFPALLWGQLSCPGTSARICPYAGPEGCSPDCAGIVGCSEATGNGTHTTFSQNCSVPAMMDMRISFSSETCAGTDPTTGPGLEGADEGGAIVDGMTFVIYDAPGGFGTFASNESFCFSNPTPSAKSVQVYFRSNRLDECIFITITHAALGSLSGCSTIPVELSDFRAFPVKDAGVRLEWQTATEESNDYFQIEHSKDGQNFNAIGQVEGAGTTREARSYTFTHDLPQPGANYYRLKQVDFDEAFSYSPVRTVLHKSEGQLFALHNITSRQWLKLQLLDQIRNSPQNPQVEIFDIWGRRVKTAEVTDELFDLDVSRFGAGSYFLRLSWKGWTQTERFLKF